MPGGTNDAVLVVVTGDYWNVGTLSPNSIPRSKNHFHCHISSLGTPVKRDGLADTVFQKELNSRCIA
jgi:hypothetical protein